MSLEKNADFATISYSKVKGEVKGEVASMIPHMYIVLAVVGALVLTLVLVKLFKSDSAFGKAFGFLLVILAFAAAARLIFDYRFLTSL